jgi:hypothetical protein
LLLLARGCEGNQIDAGFDLEDQALAQYRARLPAKWRAMESVARTRQRAEECRCCLCAISFTDQPS